MRWKFGGLIANGEVIKNTYGLALYDVHLAVILNSAYRILCGRRHQAFFGGKGPLRGVTFAFHSLPPFHLGPSISSTPFQFTSACGSQGLYLMRGERVPSHWQGSHFDR